MMKRRYWGLLLCVLLLAGCTPTAEVTSPRSQSPVQTVTPAPEMVTPTQEAENPWMEDYDDFWRVVEENYALYAAAERITGKDFEAIKEELRPLAEKAEDSSDLYTAIYKATKRFEYTGHLQMIESSWYATVMGLYRNSKDPKSAFLFERINNPRSRELYHYKEPEEVTAGGGVQSAGEQRPSATGNLIFSAYPEQSAAYVEILKMDSTDYAKDRAEMESFFRKAQAAGYQNCIVDIRRNGGGSSPYGIDMVVVPNSAEVLTVKNYALVRGGKEVLEYRDVIKDWRPLYPIEELPTQALPALEAEDLALATHYSVAELGGDGNWNSKPQEPIFTGKFWLLTSPRVYSASEYFAAFCKGTGFATLVGETTGGDGIGINPYIYVLPNSGICIQFSTENGLNADGSCNEEYGTVPDILIEQGQDALAVCLEEIGKG